MGALVGAAVVGQATVNVAVNPLVLASQLSGLYVALVQAAEAADCCTEVCRAMAATACSRAPILCKLLTIGELFEDDHQELNEAVHRCLTMTMQALQEAIYDMYEYLQHGSLRQMMQGRETKSKLKLTRQFLDDRFRDIDSYVGLATYLHVKQGLEKSETVLAEINQLRSELQALQHISAGDSAHVQAVAAAALQRKTSMGQKIGGHRHKMGHLRPRFPVALSPDGEMFATITDRWHVDVWDVATGARICRLQSPKDDDIWVEIGWKHASAAWSPNSKILLTHNSLPDSVTFWWVSRSSGVKRQRVSIRDFLGWYSIISHVVWSSDSCFLTVICKDIGSCPKHILEERERKSRASEDLNSTRVLVVNVASGEYEEASLTKEFQGASFPGAAVTWTNSVNRKYNMQLDVAVTVWNRKGNMLATGSGDSVKIWSVESFHLHHQLEGPKRQLRYGEDSIEEMNIGEALFVMAITFSPGGGKCLAAYSDRFLRMWNVPEGTYTLLEPEHKWPVISVSWSNDGRALASASKYEIFLWDATNLQQIRVIEFSPKKVGSDFQVDQVELSVCGTYLFSAISSNSRSEVRVHRVDVGQ